MESLVLCVGLIPCIQSDLQCGKVRNGWLVLLTVMGVLFSGFSFFLSALPFLLFGICLFRFRVMGSGDGKLMAVIGGYLGIWRGLYAVGTGFAIGAVWSLWKMKKFGIGAGRIAYLYQYVGRMMRTGKMEPYDTLEDAGAPHHIPFAVCLSIGVWSYLMAEALLCLYAG